jgi:hypothetical protein
VQQQLLRPLRHALAAVNAAANAAIAARVETGEAGIEIGIATPGTGIGTEAGMGETVTVIEAVTEIGKLL